MTIISAAIDPKSKQVHICCDSQITHGEIKRSMGPKYLKHVPKDKVIAYAGEKWVCQLAERIIREEKLLKEELTERRVKDFAYLLREKANEIKQEDETQADAEFLMVGNGKIFEIASDWAVYEYKKFGSIGDGSALADVVLHALLDLNVDVSTKEAVQSAVKATCKCHTECGAPIYTRTV